MPFFFLMNWKSGLSGPHSKQGTAITPSTILHRLISKSVRRSIRLFVAFIDLFLAFDSVDVLRMTNDWAPQGPLPCPAQLLPAPHITHIWWHWVRHDPQAVSSGDKTGSCIVRSFSNLRPNDSSRHLDPQRAPRMYQKETHECDSVRIARFCCYELRTASKDVWLS